MSKKALITGASSGIGEAFAYALAEKGVDVLLLARREKRLKSVAQACKDKGAQAFVYPCDLLDKTSRQATFQKILHDFPSLDLLINNAGFGTYGAFLDSPLEKEVALLELHCQVMLEAIHTFVPAMVKKRKGAVINVSSVAAFYPSPYFATYAAAKSFMLSFSLALSVELEKKGVQVLCLCPGATRTEFQKVAGIEPQTSLLPFRSSQEVVTQALQDLKKGKWLSVPGWENRAFQFLSRVFPFGAGLKLAGTVMKKSIEKGKRFA